jgi:diguanylate cyclase (GGDEF)-like protein
MDNGRREPTTVPPVPDHSGRAPERKERILLVDDDPASLQAEAQALIAAGHDVFTATSGEQALHLLREYGPPILITDWHMAGMSGIDLCRAVRYNDGIGFVYVIVLTSQFDTDALVQAFEAGADEFLPKPVNHIELLARLHAAHRIIRLQADLDRRNREVLLANARMAIATRDLEDANHRLRVLATTDELTGLINRREALHRLAQHWATSERYDSPLAVILLDIDHFKMFNDTHGHAVGDLVLREMSLTLRNACRTSDELCRIGGEEFLVICPYTSCDAATAAERMRTAVESTPIRHRPGTPGLTVTISFGVAQRTSVTANPDELIHLADEALYAAKAAGRNCVRIAAARTLPV